MLEIITGLINGGKAFWAIIGTLCAAFLYLLGKSDAKKEAKIEHLEKDVRDVSDHSRKIAKIQEKEVKIASLPSRSRESVHEWMLDLYRRAKDKK